MHLGSGRVNEAQSFFPKDGFHQFRGLMNVSREEEVRVRADLALEPIVREKIIQAEVTSVVLRTQNRTNFWKHT